MTATAQRFVPSTSLDTSATQRAGELLAEHRTFISRRTDRLFAMLLVFEWIGAMALALWRSPRLWEGTTSSVHPHLIAATMLGGAIVSLPLFLTFVASGQALTRHVVAAAQMLISALLIHIGGGSIEMHFHIFGSLAFLGFYRDWRVLLTATAVIFADHLFRGIYMPQSIYGVAGSGIWRTLEHAAWVAFEDVFLISACIRNASEMRGIAEKQALLEQSHQAVEAKVVERTRQLKDAQHDLLKSARSAGMAEIAISVLHNVGNALNSVNVAANVVTEKLRASEVASLEKVGSMIQEHQPDLTAFFTNNPQGKLIPEFVVDLARCLGDEQRDMLKELSVVSTGVEHIKQIVLAQQSLAKRGNLRTLIDPAKLVETALTMNLTANRADLRIVHRPANCPPIMLDEHKVLQILVNLVSNAIAAVSSGSSPLKQITIETDKIAADGGELLRFRVTDSGTGIAREHLARLFSHGFTTKPDGHGFGLHSAFNAAREMGGSLTAVSDGVGKGASFTLEVPIVSSPAGELCKA